jgi:hypothetical protein
MAFFEDNTGNYFLNAYVKKVDPDEYYYAYVIPKNKVKGYVILLWVSVVLAMMSFLGNSLYVFHSLYVGNTVEHMFVAKLLSGTVLAIVIIAFRNLFFKVQKVKLVSSVLQIKHSKLFYILIFLVSFNCMFAFLFTNWEGRIIGAALSIFFGLLTVFSLKRLNWIYKMA